jgi:hypothetical protein
MLQGVNKELSWMEKHSCRPIFGLHISVFSAHIHPSLLSFWFVKLFTCLLIACIFALQGCSMQVSLSKPHIEKFQGRLLEGHAYYLHYMEVKPAGDSFRAADHTLEAWLTKWTDITEITPVPKTLLRYVTDRTYLAYLRMLLIGLILQVICL